MKNLEIFQNPDFGQVRVIVNENNNPYFCLADVCKILDIGNPSDAKKRLEEDGIFLVDLNSGVTTIEGVSINKLGNSIANFIDESNLYLLIFQSRKEEAKRFKKWVASEVLPSIRKYGSYSLVPKTLPEALRAYAAEVEKNYLLEEKTKQQTLLIEELQPKADYCDEILKTKNCLTVREIAKDYGMTAQEFNRKLNEIGIQYKQGNTWLPYAPYARSGYTKSETILSEDSDTTCVLNTKWTQKGRLFLYNKLKEHGVLPLMEQEDE